MSTTTHVLTFTPGGTGHGIYTEIVELTEIGPLEIERATVIEFSQGNQQWEVRTPGGELLYTHISRVACLAWEHQQFNQ